METRGTGQGEKRGDAREGRRHGSPRSSGAPASVGCLGVWSGQSKARSGTPGMVQCRAEVHLEKTEVVGELCTSTGRGDEGLVNRKTREVGNA